MLIFLSLSGIPQSIATRALYKIMVISDLNYNFAYNFSIAAVVFGNGANITGPFSDIFAFSFHNGSGNDDTIVKSTIVLSTDAGNDDTTVKSTIVLSTDAGNDYTTEKSTIVLSTDAGNDDTTVKSTIVHSTNADTGSDDENVSQISSIHITFIIGGIIFLSFVTLIILCFVCTLR